MLAMFFNYSLKLDWRTAKLEKKNGKEQHQIDDLRSKFLALQSKDNEIRKELKLLKKKSKHGKMSVMPKKESLA